MLPRRVHNWDKGRADTGPLQWNTKDKYHDMSSDRRYTATTIYSMGKPMHQAWYRTRPQFQDAIAYLLGTFATLDDAKAACQYHRDHYVRFK